VCEYGRAIVCVAKRFPRTLIPPGCKKGGFVLGLRDVIKEHVVFISGLRDVIKEKGTQIAREEWQDIFIR